MKNSFLQKLAEKHAEGLSQYESQSAIDDYREGAKKILRLAHDRVKAAHTSYLAENGRGSLLGPDPIVLRLLDELQDSFTLV